MCESTSRLLMIYMTLCEAEIEEEPASSAGSHLNTDKAGGRRRETLHKKYTLRYECCQGATAIKSAGAATSRPRTCADEGGRLVAAPTAGDRSSQQ